MKSVTVHAGLLVIALSAAALTWTAEKEDPTSRETVTVWDRSADDVTAVAYRSSTDTVDIERRGTGADSYLWGRQSNAVLVQPEAPEVPPSANEPPKRETEEYPIGDGGQALFERLARLRALRDLGAADSTKKATYGLSDSLGAKLSVHFADGSQRTLLFGNAIVGGGAQYVLDDEASHLYVISTDLISPFLGGAGALRLTRYQAFTPEQVGSVTIRAGSSTRTMQSRRANNPPRSVWVFPGEDRQDVAFGIFMNQLDQLWVTKYTPNVQESELEPILRADYLDERGRDIGYLQLFRARGANGETVYYMKTPRTVVIGEIYAPQGQRVEQDVRTQFRPEGAAGA